MEKVTARMQGWLDMQPIRWLGACRACKTVVRLDGHFEVQNRTMMVNLVGGGSAERFVATYLVHLPGRAHPRRYTQAADFAFESAKCHCGASVAVRRVVGKHNPSRECDARCTDARGPSCSCSCGGANHGGGGVVGGYMP